MYDENLYPAILGEGKDQKWSGYLGQIEVFYTRSQVERWRKIITKLVGEFKMNPDRLLEAPETRLANIADVAKTPEEAEVMFKQALVVPARDWKLIMCEKQGKESLEDCGHSDFKTYKICARCGFKKQE
jgi:argininosuccinate lyase